ncbi:phage tail tip lysozyme [Mesorhizobium sp. B1-1-7]|uniref:phage tail tip lysozyme n=1 Tax=Mesorhizobium sp. B1-1-7 TaxID=2589977 RepID=UPI00112D7774|nr:phage tail tip lysozyme [Mesorhizobium sp. B1-1-7]TPN57171.1 hypothetical protein FJ978_00685 [Mesorhizobium sp. B1-1-7]
MANRQREPVSYRPFRAEPVLADGLLAVERPGGSILERASQGLFRLASQAGQIADRQAERQGAAAGEQAALAGRPTADYDPGSDGLSPVGDTGASAPGGGMPSAKAADGKAYLIKTYGVSNEFASGLLGQFSAESNFNTAAINRNDGADGSHSIGIGQWNGRRAKALHAFAAAKGKPVGDFYTQLDFAMHELNTTEKPVGRRLAAARSIEEATAAAVGFERPQGWTPDNPTAALGWKHRLAAARSVYGTAVAAGAAPDTTASIKPKGLVTAGNIDLHNRPVVKNDDGSISTVRSISYENDAGQEVLIPTVSNEGKILSNDEAIKYWGEKGQFLGKFDNADNATAYAKQLHEDQAQEYGAGARPPKLTIGGGTFRPTGTDTIRGRAYDEAGGKTYVQFLDSEMRSTTEQVFAKYRDDPAKLQQALGDLKGALKKDHVFPEIEADYEVGFDQLAGRYMGQARENMARKAEAQDRAAFVERTNELETNQQKRLAAFDPGSGDAADAVAADQAAIDDHYDDAVRRGILDPDDAAKAKIISRRNSALAYYGKQAEALDADGVAAMHKEMTADFADGGIAGLDGDAWSTLSTGLQKLEKQKRSQTARQETDFRKRGDSMALRLQQGLEIDPAELSQMMLDTSATPGGKAIMQETFSKISAARAINDMSLPQAVAHVAGLRKQYGQDATAAQGRTLAFAEKMLAEKRKAITTDSVSYAEKQGIVPATPALTEAETPDDMAAIVAQRAQSAEDAAKELGVTPRYLKAGEALAMAKTIRADPSKGAAMAGAIVAGAGNAVAPVLSEFGKDAPMIAEAGAIIASNGSQRAAEDVIAGYGKDAAGKPMKGLKPDAAQASFSNVIGSALAAQPEDALQIGRAAASIARKRISEEGLDPTSDEAIAVHDQAVQEAAGAVYDRGVQYGGFTDTGGGWFTSGAKVWVPNDIRADRFDDVLAAVTDDDLATLSVTPKAGIGFHATRGAGRRVPDGLAATLRSGRPVAVNGGFAFAVGDPGGDDPQWIMGSDGKPFVLDVVALRDRLAPRVPGAFR